MAEKKAFHELHASRHENLSAVLRAQMDFLKDEIPPPAASPSLQFVLESVRARSDKKKKRESFSEPGMESEEVSLSPSRASSRRSRQQALKLQALSSKFSSPATQRLPPLAAPSPSKDTLTPSNLPQQSPAASARSSLSSGRSSSLSALREESPSRRPLGREQLFRRLGLGGPGTLTPIRELRREEYAPLLGTLLETDSTTIMYR